MWWLLIPGAAAVAYKVYDSLRERDGEAPALPAVGGRELPPVGPKVRRWIEVLRPAPEGDTVPPRPPSPRPSRKFAFAPSHLTILTGVALVAATVAGRSIDAAWLGWTKQILLGALIGIATNWVAIKMLFRPKQKVLWVIQGVIPANQARIAEQVAAGVASHLLDRDTIRQAVHDSDLVGAGLDEMIQSLERLVKDAEFQSDIEELVVAYVGAFVEDPAVRARLLSAVAAVAKKAPKRIGGVMSVFSKEIGTWLESQVHEHDDAILGSLEDAVPELVQEATVRLVAWLEALPEGIEGRRGAIEQMVTEGLAHRAAAFDVEGLVRRRLEAFSIDELEALILSATDEQLAWLQYLGWVIGAAAAPLVALLDALVRLV